MLKTRPRELVTRAKSETTPNLEENKKYNKKQKNKKKQKKTKKRN